MAIINKKYPKQCSYFSDKLVLHSVGYKKDGKTINEFYYRCTLNEDIMCKRGVNLSTPLFGAKRVCVIKERGKNISNNEK